MISIDTNVIVYALDFDAGDKRIQARRILDAMLASGGLIALQVFNEFLAAATKRNIALDDAVRAIGIMRRTFTTVALSEAAFDRGLWAIRSHHLSVWDAMLWATLDQAGCRTLLTEDFQDGRTLGGVTFLNPFELANSEVVVALFRGAAP